MFCFTGPENCHQGVRTSGWNECLHTGRVTSRNDHCGGAGVIMIVLDSKSPLNTCATFLWHDVFLSKLSLTNYRRKVLFKQGLSSVLFTCFQNQDFVLFNRKLGIELVFSVNYPTVFHFSHNRYLKYQKWL